MRRARGRRVSWNRHALGGPVLLQLWRRDPVGLLERVAFGDEPAYSVVLDAWLVPDGTTLHIADDRAGLHRWPTLAEQERAEKEQERAARVALERRVAELEGKG